MVALHTRFTDPAAVETWDACFRWREGDVLRDITIDDTWRRVADAISAAEGAQAPLWAQRLAQAFSRWRLLPGESLLRLAGTGTTDGACEPPAAVLNAAEFVSLPLGGAPCLDRAALMDAAALAVRMLDDAILSGLLAIGAEPAIEVGLIGVADALGKLRVHYASDAARGHAAEFAAALAEGCLRGTVELAEERGPRLPGADCVALAALWRARGMPEALVERALAAGVRHTRLTGLHPHPQLAKLANGVGEGLVPPAGGPKASRRNDAVMHAAHEELLQAMRPWIDNPGPPPVVEATRARAPSLAVNASGLPQH